jgi:exosortase
MRLLMAFVALGVAMAYLTDRPIWQRLILVATVVPIAVMCNVLRVTITCTAYVIDKKEWGQEFMHDFTGMLMLIPAMAMLWAIGWLLSHLIVEVEVDEARSDLAGQGQEGNQA